MSIRIASRSSSSVPLTTCWLAPSPSSRIAPAIVAISSARNIDRLRGWTVNSESAGTGDDCQTEVVTSSPRIWRPLSSGSASAVLSLG